MIGGRELCKYVGENGTHGEKRKGPKVKMNSKHSRNMKESEEAQELLEWNEPGRVS